MSRKDLDQYFSPDWAYLTLYEHVPISGRIFEPCVGDGALASPILQTPGVTYLIDNDLDPNIEAAYHMDAEQDALWARVMGKDIDWVITNPPWGKFLPDGKTWDKKADPPFEILTRALAVARVGVALMLRRSWDEPTKQKTRGQWLHRNPPSLEIVQPRFSFTQDGKNDSVTSAWFVWYVGEPAGATGIRISNPDIARRN